MRNKVPNTQYSGIQDWLVGQELGSFHEIKPGFVSPTQKTLEETLTL